MAILLRIVLINLFVIQVSTENISPNSTNIQFQRNSDFDGKICDGDHVVFSEENLKKSVCLAGCASNVNCKSVFHVQDNGACIGCTNRYNSVTNPAGLSENSLYYVTVGKGCPGNCTCIANSCYFIPTGTYNFTEGVEFCESLNAHLLYIDSAEENNNIHSIIKPMVDPYILIGFTDEIIEGKWCAYGTTEAIQFINFAYNEPNGQTHDNCLHIYQHTGEWNDLSCSAPFTIICEFENMK